MVEISRIFKLMPSIARAIISRRRTILSFMMLVPFFISAIQIPPVSAGAVEYVPKAKTSIARWLAVYLPDAPYCVGKKYQVRVKGAQAIIEEQATGAKEQGEPTPVVGIRIESSVQKAGIATLSPRYRWAMDVEQDDYEFGSVYFTLSAEKAGTTDIYFETLIFGKYTEAKRSIKVVNCKYKVEMTASDVFSDGDVAIWTYGSLDTEITGEGGEMQGSGSFDFLSGFVGPPCSISYTDFQNPTTIIGRNEDNEQLALEFQFEPGTVTSSVSCPDAGGGSKSQEIDLTNTGIASATFPAIGGTRMFTFTYAGSDAPPGKMIINVQPVSEEADS